MSRAMLQEERFLKIVEYLRENGTARFSEIAQMLQMSEGTVRKDMAELDKRGMIKLVRGGAVWKQDDLTKQIFGVRDIMNRKEKQELVKCLGDIVIDGQAVALNGGTTTAEAAKFLAGNYKHLTIITNNLTVMKALREKTEFNFIVAGGIYDRKENTIVGKQAEQDIEAYNADVAILAVNAISLEKGITDFRMEELGIINAMIRSAQKKVIVADHSKFDRIACMNVCPLNAIDCILTDTGLEETKVRKYRMAGTEIVQMPRGEKGAGE